MRPVRAPGCAVAPVDDSLHPGGAPRNLNLDDVKPVTPPGLSEGNQMSLIDDAARVRENAHAPYSGFRVGAAVRTVSGRVFAGCNVENAASPEGTCAEAGAIAAMVAAGETELAEVAIVAGARAPISPCGGCRQRLAEFGGAQVPVVMATLDGVQVTKTLGELLPMAFDASHRARG